MTDSRHPLADCANCPWEPKSAYAGEGGPEDAKILVVGEAPGRVETDTGIPFTGPSGQLLDRVLAHHKIDRSEIRFTNVAACHPPYGPAVKSVTPPKEVIKACSKRLKAETEGKDGILLLGKTANSAVLNVNSSMTAARQGPPKEINGTIYVSTVHPAACLRSSDWFPDLVGDVGKFARALSGDSIYSTWQEPEYKAFDIPSEAITVLETIQRKYDLVSVDIECDVEKDTSFTHPNTLLSVGISYEPNKAVVIGEQALKDKGVQQALRRVLENLKIVYHNGKYDAQVLWRVGIINAPRIYGDTMVASYVLDERPGRHGLGTLATEILGAPSWKDAVKPYIGKDGSYGLIPRDILYKYNAYDAAETFLLWLHFEKKLDEANMRHVHNDLTEITEELAYVEFDGIGVNLDYLDQLSIEMTKELEELELALKPWVMNPRSPKQVKEALAELKLKVPSTNVETLLNLQDRIDVESEGYKFISLMFEQRKLNKLYGTYVKGTRKRLIDGRVFPTYLIHGTVFGRLAARNPNIHNVPRGKQIKRLFVPSEGNIFVQCDYSQAELRVMACEAQDRYLQGVFKDSSRDIHNEVSDTLYGRGNWTKAKRVRTKAFVFGSAYGREPFSIAQEFNISPREAEQLYNGFMGMIPEVVQWRQDVQEQVFKEGRALETHFGRKRRFWLITRENKVDVTKAALAFIPQSTAADLCLHSLKELRRQLGWSSTSPRIRNTVHDSIMVECSDSDKKEVGQLMKRVMEDTAKEIYSDYVPFTADPESGPSYGDLSE